MQSTQRQHVNGFSLIELMVAVVVAGILAAIAYPAYTSFIARGRRSEAIAALTAVVQAQERYRSNRNGYAQSFGDDGLKMQDVIEKMTKYYDITLTGVGEPAFVSGYSVTATAKTEGPQNKDKGCQVLQVELDTALLSYKSANANGDDTTSTANCWSK